MTLLEGFEKETTEAFRGAFSMHKVPADRYTDMRYPRGLPLMRFHVERYEVEGFGHLMFMQTRAMFGMMQLVTASFTPSEGLSVPYLLIDMMQMQKKRTVFVEYYDCTASGAEAGNLPAVREAYADVSEYSEKPAWYIAERMPYSLIKGTTDGSEQRLKEMVRDSVRAYLELSKKAARDPKNTEGLRSFQKRMVREGNPSSATMEKVLGKEGAEAFFRNVVMPVG